MTQQTIVLDEKRNVTLTCYLQPVGGKFEYVEKRPAMLILPGGAYQYCSDREADPVAFAYLKAGYQVFILRYSVAENCAWPAPLMDYDQAMGMIRNKAEEWNVYSDRIAVLGFSAGGHLAAAAATMGMQRPNAALLGYAVTGNEVKACNPTAPDCCGMVDDKTCPCFVFAARDDNVVPVMNSVRFIEALTEKGIAYESHIYSRGGHGFSTADVSVQNPNTEITCRARNWVEDSLGWLEEVFGTYDGRGGFTEPKLKAHLNGNYEEYLSAECTVSCLLQNAESKEILLPLLNSMQNIKTTNDTTQQEMLDLISEVKLSDLLKFAGAPADAEEKLDAQLRRIPNVKNETGSDEIAQNLKTVQENVTKACERVHRDPSEVTICAVSKLKSVQDIQAAMAAGQKLFGENYVQEIREKYEELGDSCEWHMIGHLQRNKVKYIADKVKMIHSVDSLELAQQIEKEAAKHDLVMDVLLEVNVAKEESKWGFSAEEILETAEKIGLLPHVRVRGLMTSAPYTENAETNRIYFRTLHALYEELRQAGFEGVQADTLSMGMTGDYVVAVEEGATMIRVGTGIFGERLQ